MSDLVFIAFPSEQKAEEVRDKHLAMLKECLIELIQFWRESSKVGAPKFGILGVDTRPN